MAEFALPTLDQFIKNPGYIPIAKKAVEEEDPYAKLTPAQREEADRRVAMAMKQDELAAQPRSALGEISTGFKRGAMVELPRMFGQALESTGKQGNTLYDWGHSIVQGADTREPQYAADTNEGAHGGVVNAIAQGASMLVPSVAPLAALPVLAAGGVPAAAAMGIAGAAGGAVFAGSQYQDTYEKGMKAGVPEDQVKSAALKAALIEGVGETLGTWVGGKFITGALPRILGKKYAVDEALQTVRNPKLLPALARDFAKTAAVETGTEMGQNYGEAAVEKNAGISKDDPWEAATSAIGPTLAMTAFMGPFGALGIRSKQRANQKALDTIERIDSTAKETDAALKTIASEMEPMVGKEQYSLYRLDRLKDAKWFDEAWQGVGEEEKGRVGREQLAPSGQPLLTDQTQDPTLLTEQAPKIDTTAPDPAAAQAADQAAVARDAARAQAENQRGVDTLAYQFAQQSPGLSFSEFAQQVKAGRAGPLAVGGRTTQQGIKDAYLTYLNDQEHAKQAEAQPAPETGVQGELAFGPRTPQSEVVADATARLEAAAKPPAPQEKPGQGMAKILGLPTESRIVPAEAPSKAPIDRTKQRIAALKETLPGMPKTVRESLASVDRANLPEALREIWHSRKGEAGPAYNQQVAALYTQLTGGQDIRATSVQPTQESQNGKQAESVRKEVTGSSFQDPLLIEGGQGNAEAGVSDEKGQGLLKAEPAAPPAPAAAKSKAGSPLAATTAATAGAPVSTEAGDAATARVRSQNAIDANLRLESQWQRLMQGAKGVATEITLDDARAHLERLNAAPGDNPKARALLESIVNKPAAPAAKSAVVTSTGEETPARSVGYGEWETRAPDGTITYDTPNFKGEGIAGARPPPRSQFEVRRLGRATEYRMTHNPLVPPGYRRNVDEAMLFSFETNQYDPKRTRGFADNAQWIADVRKAYNLARGRNVEGTNVELTPAEMPEAAKEKANAQGALKWLKQNYPEDYDAALAGYDPTKPGEGNSRLAQADRIRDLDMAVHEVADEALERTYELYKEAYQMRVAQEKGLSNPDRVTISPTQEDRLREMAARDPGLEYAQAELPNYTHSDSLAQELGRGNLDRVLSMLDQNGPSDWMQKIAHALWLLGLKTKVVLVNRISYAPDGNRVYGKYQHLTDTVRVFPGGANPHTVVHEVTHAASVGNILFAKAAEKKIERTREEAAAVARLNDLRAIIEAVGFTAQDKSRIEEEFVAEVFSNERMQQQLRTMAFDNRSLWQRFKDWVGAIFGGPQPELGTALEAAISRSLPFLGESRFGAATGLEFDHSITAAFGMTDNTVSALTQKLDGFSSQMRSNLPGTWSAVWMKLASTAHLIEMVGRIKHLAGMLPGMKLYNEADRTGMQIRQQVNSEIEQVLKPLNAYFAKLGKGREAVDARMQELGGGASRLGIDLSKNYDENKATFNKNLDPSLKARVNELHLLWKQQPAIVRQTLQRAVLVNRKHYMQHSANLLKLNTQAYGKKQPGVVSTVNRLLNIMDPKLNEGTNPNTKFFADVYTANLSHRIDLALKAVRDAEKGTNSALAQETELIESIYRKSVASPYVHLGRSGEHFLEFTVAPGDVAWQKMQAALSTAGKVIDTPTQARKVFMRFENASDQMKALDAVNALGPTVITADTTRAGVLSDTNSLSSLNKGLSFTLRQIASNLSDQFEGEAKKELREALIAEVYSHMGDDSPSHALKRRKEGGVPGYDAEFRRSFVKRGAGASSLISNSYTMPMHNDAFRQMQDVVNDMRAPKGGPTAESVKHQEQAQAVLSSFQQRFSNKINRVESPLIDKFKALGYNWFLAASPAFMLTNLMQPYHLTLPYLGGTYGFVRAAKEMGRASAKAISLVKQASQEGWVTGKTLGGVAGGVEGAANLSVHGSADLSAGEQSMIVELMRSGQLDLGLARELTSLASGTAHAWQVTMRVLATGSHYSEVVNRLTAALAAYNLDAARGGPAAHERATAAAIRAVELTQFNYSDYNTAPAFGRHGLAGKVTPLLTSFQNYSFQVMELIHRMAYDSVAKSASAEDKLAARKALAGVLATTATIAGALGLPLASVVARLYDAAAGSDDDPSDIKASFRAWLAEVFGKDVGEAIARGVPRAVLGFDTSTRAGLADVVPGSRFFTDRRMFKDKMEAGAFDMMGPAVSATQEFLTGLGKMSDGFVMEGLMQMAPLALRGPLKTGKMLDKGYTTANGIPLPMEVTPWAAVVQTLGFTPSVKAEQSDVNFAFRQRDGLLKQRKTVLSNQLYRVFDEGGDPTEALQAALAFSQQNPQYAIDVASGMKARAASRATANVAEAAIATSPRYLPLLQQYSFANTR